MKQLSIVRRMVKGTRHAILARRADQRYSAILSRTIRRHDGGVRVVAREIIAPTIHEADRVATEWINGGLVEIGSPARGAR